MREVYNFIELASEAARLIGSYYNCSIDKDGLVNESFGSSDSCLFKVLMDESNGGNILIPFNDVCSDITSAYEKIIKEYGYDHECNGDNCDNYADGLLWIVEEQMMHLDDLQRNVLVSRTVKRAASLIIGGRNSIEYSYQICDHIDEYGEDIKQMSKSFWAINFFLGTINVFFYKVGDLCQDYGIDIKEMCLRIFNKVPPECLYLSIFDNTFGSPLSKNGKAAQLNKKNDFTLYRKKEAIVAMLEALGVRLDGAGAIPEAQIKKFVHFLTGCGTIEDDIRNTTVANIFKASKDTRNDDTVNNDLNFVAARFEDVGLFEIAKKIRNGKI